MPTDFISTSTAFVASPHHHLATSARSSPHLACSGAATYVHQTQLRASSSAFCACVSTFLVDLEPLVRCVNGLTCVDRSASSRASKLQWTSRHRVGVGFSEGQSLLPFYADSGRKATFTILCQFQAGRFYRFTALETEFFSAGALRAPGKPPHTQQPMPITRPPAPHPRLAPLPTLASVASRATITRRSPPHRDRWRRPALRHPAQPRNSEISRAPAARMTFTILRELCRPYTFTILRQKSLTFTEPSPYAGPVGRWCGFSIFIIGENRTVFVLT
jgi:hypothetical protein